MFFLPKIEKITKHTAISHFFLMFSYKLFSIYFPLFLAVKGMSLPEIGYVYLLIYLPIAIFAPIAGFLNHKINPAVLASFGILGYAIYAGAMILIREPFLFYLFQVFLGISASLFQVSIRAILIGSDLENYDRSFGWFYSATFYADAVAPAIGAFFVWKFGFTGVFIFSLIINVFNSVFCFIKLRKPARLLVDNGFGLKDSKINYLNVSQFFKRKRIFLIFLASFSVLLLIGFYRAFFVLFLRDQLNWSQEYVLVFMSFFSLLFLPLSLLILKHLEKTGSEKNIFQGGFIAGFFSVILGLAMPFLNFLSALIINLGKYAGDLICNSGRSGFISDNLKTNPEEAGAIDSVFSPLGVAFGALVSGLIIGILGYQFLFIFGGLIIMLIITVFKKLAKT